MLRNNRSHKAHANGASVPGPLSEGRNGHEDSKRRLRSHTLGARPGHSAPGRRPDYRGSPQSAHVSHADLVSAAEQRALDRANEPDTYGTTDTIVLQIPAAAFTIAGNNFMVEDVHGYFYVTSADSNARRLVAPVNLPAGAQIRWLDLYYHDTDAANNFFARLYSFAGSSTSTVTTLGEATSTGSAGKGYAADMLSPLVTVDNQETQYDVYLYGLSTDQSRKFRAVNIWYRLQMSPSPATATFNDVSTSYWAFQGIEALAASGITTGCPAPNFCPEQYVTRAQMAMFLARALGLTGSDTAPRAHVSPGSSGTGALFLPASLPASARGRCGLGARRGGVPVLEHADRPRVAEAKRAAEPGPRLPLVLADPPAVAVAHAERVRALAHLLAAQRTNQWRASP